MSPEPGASPNANDSVPRPLQNFRDIAAYARAEGEAAPNSAAFFKIEYRMLTELEAVRPMVLDGVNYRIHLVQRAAQGNNVIQQTRGPVWSDIDRIAQELRAIHPEWGKGQVAAHILKTRQPTHAQDKVYSLKHIVRRISHLWPKPRQNPIYKNGE